MYYRGCKRSMTYIPIPTSSSDRCDGCPEVTRSAKKEVRPGKIPFADRPIRGGCMGPAVFDPVLTRKLR